jgi:hypothetical protein
MFTAVLNALHHHSQKSKFLIAAGSLLYPAFAARGKETLDSKSFRSTEMFNY